MYSPDLGSPVRKKSLQHHASGTLAPILAKRQRYFASQSGHCASVGNFSTLHFRTAVRYSLSTHQLFTNIKHRGYGGSHHVPGCSRTAGPAKLHRNCHTEHCSRLLKRARLLSEARLRRAKQRISGRKISYSVLLERFSTDMGPVLRLLPHGGLISLRELFRVLETHRDHSRRI